MSVRPLAALVFALLGVLSSTAAAVPPPSASARYQEGLRLARAGQLAEALRKLKEAVEIDPTFAEAWVEAGNVELGLEDPTSAVASYRAALAARPSMGEAQYNLAHALKKAGQTREAVEAYRAYLLRNPTDADAYFGLGESLRALGDGRAAVQAFRRYVRLESREDRRRFVAEAERAIAELDAPPPPAVAEPTPAPTPAPSPAAVSPVAKGADDELRRELVAIGEARFEGAELRLAQIPDEGPFKTLGLAAVWLGLGDVERAEPAYRRVAEAAAAGPPLRAVARFGLAECLRRMERGDEADALLDELKRDPALPEALARALAAQED